MGRTVYYQKSNGEFRKIRIRREWRRLLNIILHPEFQTTSALRQARWMALNRHVQNSRLILGLDL